MNNEDKRFKQINRIATPIRVDENGQRIEEPKVDQPVENTVKIKKTEVKKKKLKKETILEALIIVVVIGIILSSAYLLIPNTSTKSNLKYNDISTTKKDDTLEEYFFESINLNERLYLEEGFDYQVGPFTLKTLNSSVFVNNTIVGTHSKVSSNVALIDDLLLFVASSDEERSTVLYAIDTSGNKVLEMYHVGDINGMVIESVVFNRISIVIVAKNVIGDSIIPNNTINNMNPVSICSEDKLFENSIEINKPVIVHYSYTYKGKHEFSEGLNIYEVSLDKYKKDNNYCQ